MALNCYIVDDELHAIEVLKRHIENTPGLSLIGSDTDPIKAWDTILNKKVIPDLLFLDINMPQISGIKLAGLVKTMTRVIFTTAYPDYGPEAFEAEAIDYLMKPVSYGRFIQSVTKAKILTEKQSTILSPRDEAFYIKKEEKGRIVKINFDNVIYIEGNGNYINIEGDDGRQLVHLSLRSLEIKLPAERFIRIHRSFIVNLKRIVAVEKRKVVMDNHIKIEIGSGYKGNLLALINTMLVSKDS